MLTKRWLLVFMLGATIALQGCVEHSIITPTADAFIVHAVLDMNERDQYVILQHTTGRLPDQRAVVGATVTITTPEGHVLTAQEIADSTRFTTNPSTEPKLKTLYLISLDANDETLVPGGTYRLRIQIKGASDITGETTLPAVTALSDTIASTSFNWQSDTLRLSWPRVAFAQAYQVNIHSSRGTFATFADTSVSLAARSILSTANQFFQPDAINRLNVLAVDANYYDYYRRSTDVFTGVGVISHLHGAIGVFGSVARVSQRTLVSH